MNLLITVVLIIVIVIVVLSCAKDRKEKFLILGALAPYKKDLVNCLNHCEHDDPNKRFGPSHTNCSLFCIGELTKASKNNIKPGTVFGSEYDSAISYCSDPPKSKLNSRTPYAKRTKVMSSHSPQSTKGICYDRYNKAELCGKLWCPYSLDDNCMHYCQSGWLE